MSAQGSACTQEPIRPVLTSECPSDDGREISGSGEKEDEYMECGVCGGGDLNATFKRGPREPSENEILEHYATHVPFRSWCPHCVAAAGKATPHFKTKDSEGKTVPCIHADYWFMRDQRGAESMPVIVIRDDDTKAFGAHVVTVKGNVEWVAEKVAEDIEKMGHVGKISMKTDQESALKDLRQGVKEIRAKKGQETIPEESKVYDSQSNGVAERAVQSVECIVRTHKFALEKRIGKKIPCAHPIMTWLVENATDMLNKFHVGKDGRTAHERIRGKPYHGEVVDFGKRVFHMYPGKHHGGSMKERWGKGIILGKLWTSDEYVLFSDEGKIVKARSIKLMLESESWISEEVEKVNIARWKAQFAGEESPLEEREEDDEDDPVARLVVPRDFIIKQEYLETFGYSEDCGRCRVLSKGGKPTQHHTKKCRERIRKLLEESEQATILTRATERQNEYIAKQVRAAEDKGDSAVFGGGGDPGGSNRGGVPAHGGTPSRSLPLVPFGRIAWRMRSPPPTSLRFLQVR